MHTISGISQMASQILGNITDKAKSMAGGENKKVAQLAADTKDVHDRSYRITSDYGVKQHDTDHWLAASTEDKQGPQLLEDPFGREKVCSMLRSRMAIATNIHRFTASITSVSPSELFTHEALALSESSSSSSPPQMSPRLAS